jgi:hypothetical protein
MLKNLLIGFTLKLFTLLVFALNSCIFDIPVENDLQDLNKLQNIITLSYFNRVITLNKGNRDTSNFILENGIYIKTYTINQFTGTVKLIIESDLKKDFSKFKNLKKFFSANLQSFTIIDNEKKDEENIKLFLSRWFYFDTTSNGYVEFINANDILKNPIPTKLKVELFFEYGSRSRPYPTESTISITDLSITGEYK